MPKRLDCKPWERQPKESTQAYEAFKTYLEMGDNRSHVKVGLKLGKSTTIIDRWGSAWNWQQRIREHDIFIQTEADKKLIKSEKDRRIRLGAISDHITLFAMEGFKNFNAKDMTPAEFLAYMRMAVALNNTHRTVLPKEAEDREANDLLGAMLLAFEAEDNDDG